MASSMEHNAARLGALADDVRRGKDTSAEKQASQIVRWAQDLTRWESQDVAKACQRWRDEHEVWPDGWLQLRRVVDDVAAARHQAQCSTAQQPQHVDPAELLRAVNAAFGLLSNGHLREFDRVEGRRRWHIAQAVGRFFLPHMDTLARAATHADRRQLIEQVTQFVERQIGKTWRQILNEEQAVRSATPDPVRGFKQVPDQAEPLPVAAE